MKKKMIKDKENGGLIPDQRFGITSVEKRVEQKSKLSKSPVCVLNKELKVSVMLVHLVFTFTN